MTLDLEKALDSVAWPYMFSVLEAMGFGAEFLKWIEILYRSLTAQIKLGGDLSSSLSVVGGTRQGCLLSPALFALMMELLASALRRSSAVVGISVGTLEEK